MWLMARVIMHGKIWTRDEAVDAWCRVAVGGGENYHEPFYLPEYFPVEMWQTW